MLRLPKRPAGGAILLLLAVLLAGCGGVPPQVVYETVVVVQTSAPLRETVLIAPSAASPAATPAPLEVYATPHPILSDLRVRQAIAYCTNRPELIAAVYPFLDESQQASQLMDSFLPTGHWALASEGLTRYPFNSARGQALLDEAGWQLFEDETTRTNADGEPLALKFTTTNAQFRQTWGAVFAEQMAACGIEIVPTYAPSTWLFGSSTGLRRRDFELAGFGWTGQADPDTTLAAYACNQIPTPANNWDGQNFMGWCNPTASKALVAANNTLDRQERVRQFAIAQQEFSEDLVSLPLFNRIEAAATSIRLLNFRPDPSEEYTANIAEWRLADGDSVVLGFTQEPSTLWSLIESSAVTDHLLNLISVDATTSYGYDFQPAGLEALPTLESGAARNELLEVAQGERVWNSAGEAVTLEPGVEVVDAAGDTVIYEGGTLAMHQLTVTDTWAVGLRWEDGEPVRQADFELAYRISCDPEAGAVTQSYCESIQSFVATSDTSYSVTFLPGVQWSTYFTGVGLGAYPAHQRLSDGRTLAEVPAAEWATLPEIVERPLSNGPYVLERWDKGVSMTFRANPHYYKGEPAIKTVIVKFIPDTNQAVAQLLTAEVDVLGAETLGAGAELAAVLAAANDGQLRAYTTPSSSWEHLDMNQHVK